MMGRLALTGRISMMAALIAGGSLAVGTLAPRSGQAETTRVGQVDVLTLLEDVLKTEEFRPARDQLSEALGARLEAAEREISRVQTELELMTPGDPNGQQLFARFQEMQQQYQVMRQESSAEFNQLSAIQAADAYSRIHEATNEVADELGVTHVVASRTSPVLAESTTFGAAYQEIIARPMLRVPEGDDLTEAVREHMGLNDLPAEEPDAADEAPDGDDSTP